MRPHCSMPFVATSLGVLKELYTINYNTFRVTASHLPLGLTLVPISIWRLVVDETSQNAVTLKINVSKRSGIGL